MNEPSLRRAARAPFLVGAAVAAAFLAGCSSPTPAPVLLSLPPALGDLAAAPPPVGASAPLLAVGRVGLPEYEVARRVRYRADASTLGEWPNTYWAERIEIGTSREFVSALRQQLPGWATCESECAESTPALALQVTIVPMDFVRSAKQLQARARIVVREGKGAARPLATTERAYTLPASADSAQAQAETITQLLREIAKDAAALVKSTAAKAP